MHANRTCNELVKTFDKIFALTTLHMLNATAGQLCWSYPLMVHMHVPMLNVQINCKCVPL